MLRPGRNNHQIPRLNNLILPINRRLALTTRKRQGLVNGMHFVADITADGDCHEHYLGVEACEEDFAEFA
jgi:hypothetical protein